ncbi:MAG TPA: hypothetical protein VFN18_07040 [Solirubrobacterales bacterium]|nr:hypothetical protein [Solirubrobacterales bacterium]
MNCQKLSGLVLAGLCLYAAIFGTGSASATILSVGGVTKNEAVSITATLLSGTSAIWKTSGGTTLETCTTSELQGKTEAPFSGTTVNGSMSKWSFGGCSEATNTISTGGFSISWISGTTNGTLSSNGTEHTMYSTLSGTSAICKTGAGTVLGTVTGSSGGHITIDIDAKVTCGILGTITWVASYTVTSPTGLAVEKEAPPVEPTTELFQSTGGTQDTLPAGTELAASLQSGSSMSIKDDHGVQATTCTGSEFNGKTEVSGKTVTLPLSNLAFTGCSHTTKVLKPGKLHFAWTSGSNATVSSSEAEVTVVSTAYGISSLCKTTTGTPIGTLTGAKEGNATLDVNSKVDCGILGLSTWTGTYTITKPTGLVAGEAITPTTELFQSTGGTQDTLPAGTELAASLQSSSSTIIKDSGASLATTCTGSEFNGKTEVSGKTVTLPLSNLAFTGCSHTTKVLKPGKLHFAWTSGSNATVSSSEAELTVVSTAFGLSSLCKTGTGTTIGTLTGAKEGNATLDVNSKVDCGFLGLSPWTGTYTITKPTGLVAGT